jgi:hypothetical protein
MDPSKNLYQPDSRTAKLPGTLAARWAAAIQQVRLDRPTCALYLDKVGGQPHGLKDVAFVIAIDGQPHLQLKGGILSPEQGRLLANWIYDHFVIAVPWPATTVAMRAHRAAPPVSARTALIHTQQAGAKPATILARPTARDDRVAPKPLTKSELGDASGYEAGGTFRTYLPKLKRLGLVE